MDNYIDPNRFPEWYSAQYTEQNKNIFIDNNKYQ
jgi:hypothetical protein